MYGVHFACSVVLVLGKQHALINNDPLELILFHENGVYIRGDIHGGP